MDRLRASYGDRIEFIKLDVDDSASLPLRQQYDIIARSNYVLTDAQGAVLRKWFGYISENDVAGVLDGVLG